MLVDTLQPPDLVVWDRHDLATGYVGADVTHERCLPDLRDPETEQATVEQLGVDAIADGELRGHPIILLLNGVPGDDRRTGARHESAEKHGEPACGRECGHTTEEAFSALPLLYDGTYIRYSGCQTAAATRLSISSCDMTSPAPSREAVAITAAAT